MYIYMVKMLEERLCCMRNMRFLRGGWVKSRSNEAKKNNHISFRYANILCARLGEGKSHIKL